MENSIKQIIADHPWLQDLFTDMPRRFYAQLELITVPAHKRIITKGTDNPFIYILYHGNYRAINEFSNGRVFEFSASSQKPALANAFSGLLEFFSGFSIATTTIEVTEASSYIRIRKSVFARWLDEDFNAYKKIVKIFARQMYPSVNSHGKMVVYTGLYSLANYLFQNYSGRLDTDDLIIVSVTREAMCQELGMSIRTMYRLCNELVEKDMIHIIKKKIHISGKQMDRITEFLDDEEDTLRP